MDCGNWGYDFEPPKELSFTNHKTYANNQGCKDAKCKYIQTITLRTQYLMTMIWLWKAREILMLITMGNLCVLLKSLSKVIIILKFLQEKNVTSVLVLRYFPRAWKKLHLGAFHLLWQDKLRYLEEVEDCLITFVSCEGYK
jgi:hypothetical protein